MTDIELDIRHHTPVRSRATRRDKARPLMRLRRPADGDLAPRDATRAVDEEIFQQIRGQRHVSVLQTDEFLHCLLVVRLQGLQQWQRGGRSGQASHVNVPSCERSLSRCHLENVFFPPSSNQ